MGDKEVQRRIGHFRLASPELGVLGHHGGFGDSKAWTIVIGRSSSALQNKSSATKMRTGSAACAGCPSCDGLRRIFSWSWRLCLGDGVWVCTRVQGCTCTSGAPAPIGCLRLSSIARLYSPIVPAASSGALPAALRWSLHSDAGRWAAKAPSVG